MAALAFFARLCQIEAGFGSRKHEALARPFSCKCVRDSSMEGWLRLHSIAARLKLLFGSSSASALPCNSFGDPI